MTFYGRTYKRKSAPNAAEIFEKLGFKEEAYGLLRSTDASFTFDKNNDGSIRFIGALNSGLILNQKWYPNQESGFVTATGAVINVYLTIHDNVIKFIIRLPTGKRINADAYFSDDALKLEFYIPGVDVVSVMYYEAI